MKQEVLKSFDLPLLPLTALVLFVVCFSVYAWWTYRKANRAYYEAAGMIPLEDPMVTTHSMKGKSHERP